MLWRWPPCGAGSQMPTPQSQRPAEPAQVGSCLSFLCSFVLSSLQCRRGGIGSAEFGSKEVFCSGVRTDGLVQRNPAAAQFWRSANATALHRGNIALSSSAYGLLRTVYGSDFPVPTFALPRNVALSLTTSR